MEGDQRADVVVTVSDPQRWLQRMIQPSCSFSYPTFTTKGWKKYGIVTARNLDQEVLKLSVLEIFWDCVLICKMEIIIPYQSLNGLYVNYNAYFPN